MKKALNWFTENAELIVYRYLCCCLAFGIFCIAYGLAK